MVIVGLVRSVVPTVDPMALRTLLIIYHLFQVWVLRIDLLFEVNSFASNV